MDTIRQTLVKYIFCSWKTIGAAGVRLTDLHSKKIEQNENIHPCVWWMYDFYSGLPRSLLYIGYLVSCTHNVCNEKNPKKLLKPSLENGNVNKYVTPYKHESNVMTSDLPLPPVRYQRPPMRLHPRWPDRNTLLWNPRSGSYTIYDIANVLIITVPWQKSLLVSLIFYFINYPLSQYCEKGREWCAQKRILFTYTRTVGHHSCQISIINIILVIYIYSMA